MSCQRKFWKILVLVIAGVAALGWVVMSLWNWLLPSLFTGVHQIAYVQALGLLVLCKILFGGFRGRGCHHHHRQRWEQMSEEEREKFKQGMRGWRGRWSRSERQDVADARPSAAPKDPQ
jgi:hypothetical protein